MRLKITEYTGVNRLEQELVHALGQLWPYQSWMELRDPSEELIARYAVVSTDPWQRSWSFDWHINVGHLTTTLVQLVDDEQLKSKAFSEWRETCGSNLAKIVLVDRRDGNPRVIAAFTVSFTEE